MYRLLVFVSFLFIFVTNSGLHAEAPELPKISLIIANHELHAEVAHTEHARAKGLMFRPSLAENTGLLFVFPQSAYYSMWMRNTMIPLSVAFINEKGSILNIAEMKPYSLTAHRSAGPAKYALEMNSRWFANREIQAGEQITGLEHAPAAE